jgi:copper(I)-binding protein
VPRIARRTSVRVAAAALALVALPALAGCAVGTSAGTGLQKASGNGANADAGALRVRDLTIVQGKDGAPTGTFIGTVVNTGDSPDALVGVRVVDPAAGQVLITGTQAADGKLPFPGVSSTRIGYNSEEHIDVVGLTASPTQFVTVELQFEVAGRVQLQVMAVPPTGIYEGIGPLSAS